MARTDRRSARHLIKEIGNDAPRFRFFQAVRLLALSAPERDTATIPQALRFGSPLSLAFPASEILAANGVFDFESVTGIAAEADEECVSESTSQSAALQLTVGFMGLTGPSGVLPAAYTEALIERRNTHRDTAAHRFLDMFSHRAISLFYEAWRKHRFYIAYESGDRGGFSRNLLDLVGVGLSSLQPGLQRAGGIPEAFLSYFAGLLSQKPVSATNLAALLQGYLGVEAKIEQFVGQWVALPALEQTALGQRACVLGEDAFVGDRMWDRQNKVRILLGPLDDAQFADFLPGRPGAVAVAGLVQLCTGQTLACDLTLSLRKDCVPRAVFDSAQPSAAGMRLGYNVWLHHRRPSTDLDEASFALLN